MKSAAEKRTQAQIARENAANKREQAQQARDNAANKRTQAQDARDAAADKREQAQTARANGNVEQAEGLEADRQALPRPRAWKAIVGGC